MGGREGLAKGNRKLSGELKDSHGQKRTVEGV